MNNMKKNVIVICIDGCRTDRAQKSKIFTGKSKIEQHKIVYKALRGKMGNELHALALNTMER